jgi:hypothetical protein
MPPSTAMLWPVTNEAASLARKTTTPAISSGFPQRPSAVRVFSQRAHSGSLARAALTSVANVPGATEFTVIP